MSLDAATIARYQPGPPPGDIYTTLQTEYGTQSANSIAAAAATGDNNGEVAAAISQAQFGNPLDTSTADALETQLSTNPLLAPTQALENQIKAAVQDLFSNPYVLIALGAGIFLALGGLQVIKDTISKQLKL